MPLFTREGLEMSPWRLLVWGAALLYVLYEVGLWI